MQSVKIHTSKDKTWTNSAGDAVPFKFVPAVDKAKEAYAAKIYKAALQAEEGLIALHTMMNSAFLDISNMLKEEYKIKNKKEKETKGSLTWFSFRRDVKVEAEINELVKWDNALMKEALLSLNTYISKNMSEANELISGLVKSAFANSRGMIDTGKVFQLLKYEDKIKSASFQKACELMKKAQSIDKTKLYMRVWLRQPDGEYRNVNLNFSSI